MSTHLVSTIGGEERAPPKRGWAKFIGCVGNCLRYEDKVKWVEDMRGVLSLMASIIATMTFQLATNPPGGVFQANGGSKVSEVMSCVEHNDIQCPGEAVLAVVYKDDYRKFLISNTVSFIASLSVCLLLVSGIPLKNRLIIWVLSIGMCITITSLAFTYMYATNLVTPDPVWEAAHNMFDLVLKIWVILLGIVGFFIILRVLYHVIKWITKCNPSSNNENRMSN